MPRRMFEAGMSRRGRSIRTALRIRVSISAIGSVIMARGALVRGQWSVVRFVGERGWGGNDRARFTDARRDHQLAFFTPGISPRLARLRKQIRQMPNLR